MTREAERTKYPLLRVRLDKIRENGLRLVAECGGRGISLWGVTKGTAAEISVARAFLDAGIKTLADSRLDNIRKMKDAGIDADFALLRVPMKSELAQAAALCDYILVSDMDVISSLGEICERTGRTVKCVVMFDMGDLREGFWFEDAREVAEGLAKFNDGKMKIDGVGANFSCASGVLPTKKNLEALAFCGETLERALGRKLSIYSGGATATFVVMRRGEVPEKFNNLRIGEALLLGRDTSFFIPALRGLCQDTMQIEAELVEAKVKPTVPVGETGRDAFGNVPVFADRGRRRRGVLAIGKQDVNISGLEPLDEGVEIITASSDHLLVDIEERPDLKAGGVLKFRPDYGAMLAAFTSPYVKKVFE